MTTLTFTDQEIELLKAAMNKVCADYIGQSVDITYTQDKKELYLGLYEKSCTLRNKIYDLTYSN